MISVFKNKKFIAFLWAAIIVAAILTGVLVGGAPKRHNESLKKNIHKVMSSTAQECGIENFEVVYVDDSTNERIVFAGDKMSEISYDNKVKFFDKTAELLGKYEFFEWDIVAVYSDGNRYTASGDTLTSYVYENGETIDPETNRISVHSFKFNVSDSADAEVEAVEE